MLPASGSKSSMRALDWQDACTPAAREAGKASLASVRGGEIRKAESAPDVGDARQPERTAKSPSTSIFSSCSTERTPPSRRPPATACPPGLLQVLRNHPSQRSHHAHTGDARYTAVPLLSAGLSPGTTASGTADSHCVAPCVSCAVICHLRRPRPRPRQEQCLSIPICTGGNGSPGRWNVSLALPSPSLTVVP